MMMDILKEFHKSKNYSKSNVAKSLGISQQIVDCMFNKLVTLNYIEKINNFGCSGNCGGDCSESCKSGTGCFCGGSSEFVDMWQLTKKGEKALERM